MKRYKFKLRGYDVRIKPDAYFPNEVWVAVGKAYGPFFRTYDKGLMDAKRYDFDYLRIAHEFIDLHEKINEIEARNKRNHEAGIEKLERYIEESEGGEEK